MMKLNDNDSDSDSSSVMDKSLFFFGGIDKCKFRKPVVPGDTLVLKTELVKLRKRFGIATMKGIGTDGGYW